MFKNLVILATIAIVVALPFIFRREQKIGAWQNGDPILVIVTPHNEAIRYEFEHGFAKWHEQKFGKPVKIDWRNIGGTTEISRYLQSEYANSMRQWWLRSGKVWPAGMGSDLLVKDKKPADPAQAALWDQVRLIDDSEQFTSGIDLFFGGGEYDHTTAFRNGMTVEPWPAKDVPKYLFAASDGTTLIPDRISGETWRSPTVFGNAVSTFGIVYNVDRLRDLNIAAAPSQWRDLANPVYRRQVGLADPTKSGSIAKAFEMIVHQQIHESVIGAGFTDVQITAFEKLIATFKTETEKSGAIYERGSIPATVPPNYQSAIEQGWLNGMMLVQQIGANGRYFTDSASKVPIDVSIGDAAVGMAIDFYGRYQAQSTRGPGGSLRMMYVTPVGGSSVSCDPISLLRGAKNRELAVRFIEYVLSEDGQRLWTYKAGTPGGPEKFTLRRLPVRRDFYPSTQAAFQASHEEHARYAADDLSDPRVDPYQIAKTFVYNRRWTGDHFGVQRDLIKAMCMDSSDELREAWDAICNAGGPERNLPAMGLLTRLPAVMLTPLPAKREDPPNEPVRVNLTWSNAPEVMKKFDKLEISRQWTAFFRESYKAARSAVGGKSM